MKHIVLTGGGTAGHVTPNIALIPRLKELEYEISYIGSIFSLIGMRLSSLIIYALISFLTEPLLVL